MAASTIKASAVQAGAGTVLGSAIALNPAITSGRFVLDVTVAQTLVGDTLDVFVQTSSDGGVTYDDFVHFTQVLGNGGVKTFIAQWSRDIAPTAALHARQDGVLAAGVSQGPLGSFIRAKAVTVGTGSFTFAVTADLLRQK